MRIHILLLIAPRLMGGRDATPSIGGLGLSLADALRLGALEVSRCGDDLLIEADVPPGAP